MFWVRQSSCLVLGKHLQRLSLHICLACPSTSLSPLFSCTCVPSHGVVISDLSAVEISSHCVSDICLAALGRTGCPQSPVLLGSCRGQFAKAPSVFLWTPPRTRLQLWAWSTELKLQLLETGTAGYCMGGDHGLIWVLCDPLKQPTAPQNLSYSEEHAGAQPEMSPAQLPVCWWGLEYVWDKHFSLKSSWNCLVTPKVAWGWITRQADSSCFFS